VVADSVPEAEWQETWDKASGILLAAERMSGKPAEVSS
jgi:anthranilate/para-aminobenzoate synthase component I